MQKKQKKVSELCILLVFNWDIKKCVPSLGKNFIKSIDLKEGHRN